MREGHSLIQQVNGMICTLPLAVVSVVSVVNDHGAACMQVTRLLNYNLNYCKKIILKQSHNEKECLIGSGYKLRTHV